LTKKDKKRKKSRRKKFHSLAQAVLPHPSWPLRAVKQKKQRLSLIHAVPVSSLPRLSQEVFLPWSRPPHTVCPGDPLGLFSCKQ
jgi:hypothetical protein